MTEMETIEIRMVETARICPDSSVNVRRTGVEENAERLRDSIARRGYQQEHPVLLRPYSGDDGKYEFEVVSGRSRFKGAVMAGMRQVPCVNREMDDEEAHKASFSENMDRGALSVQDETHWYEKQFQAFREKHHTRTQAVGMTARFYGVSEPTVRNRLLLASLPDELLDKVDKGIIGKGVGEAISKRYHQMADEEAATNAMNEAAQWLLGLTSEHRKLADQAIGNSANEGTRDDLQAALDQLIAEGQRDLNVKIAPSMRGKLDRFAEQFGYPSGEAALPMIIANAIRDAGIE